MCDYSDCAGGVSIPYTCRRCGGDFCVNHRLPENHECTGLAGEAFRGRVLESTHSARKDGRDSKFRNASVGVDPEFFDADNDQNEPDIPDTTWADRAIAGFLTLLIAIFVLNFAGVISI